MGPRAAQSPWGAISGGGCPCSQGWSQLPRHQGWVGGAGRQQASWYLLRGASGPGRGVHAGALRA